MFNTYDTYQAEIEYRSNRIRRDLKGRSRRVRTPFGRKQGQSPRNAA